MHGAGTYARNSNEFSRPTVKLSNVNFPQESFGRFRLFYTRQQSSWMINVCSLRKERRSGVPEMQTDKAPVSVPEKNSDTKKTTPNIEVCRESLRVKLKYWYIERRNVGYSIIWNRFSFQFSGRRMEQNEGNPLEIILLSNFFWNLA